MVKLTKAQREAVFRVYQRDWPSRVTPFQAHNGPYCERCGWGHGTHRVPSITYRRFRAQVQPGPGCVMLPWQGMWLGIEPDGHTHS